jgi:mono/diheme cytochrome c family protein
MEMRKVMVLKLAIAVLFVVAVVISQTAQGQGDQGQQIFRFDTFGDEQLWTDTLRLHEVIQSSVSPTTALGVGLKVDAAALPPNFLATRDLNSPATTVELIKLNAVVGLVGNVKGTQLKSVGITCAICHSTVDNSVAAGIGNRLDGWPNRDLNPGAIIALSPALTAAQKAVYNSWGPGRFDPRFNVDGLNGPVLIPPAYGLKGVGFETYTGDGPISYWNNYVAVLEMGGHGSFSDPRLGINIVQEPDQVTPKLPELLRYQLSLAAPPPPAGSFDQVAARRGEALFKGKAGCAACHIPPTFTDVLSGPDPPRRWAWIRFTRNEVRQRNIARPRFGHYGSIHLTSTTEVPAIWTPWLIITTGCLGLGSARNKSAIWLNTLNRCEWTVKIAQHRGAGATE